MTERHFNYQKYQPYDELLKGIRNTSGSITKGFKEKKPITLDAHKNFVVLDLRQLSLLRLKLHG